MFGWQGRPESSALRAQRNTPAARPPSEWSGTGTSTDAASAADANRDDLPSRRTRGNGTTRPATSHEHLHLRPQAATRRPSPPKDSPCPESDRTSLCLASRETTHRQRSGNAVGSVIAGARIPGSFRYLFSSPATVSVTGSTCRGSSSRCRTPTASAAELPAGSLASTRKVDEAVDSVTPSLTRCCPAPARPPWPAPRRRPDPRFADRG